MRIPYFISFYSSVLLILGGLAVDGPDADGLNWTHVLMSLAVVAILLGILDVVSSHKRGAGGL